MALTLAEFAQHEIDAQGLTVKEFARRGGLGLSHAYQILRGERPRSSIETIDAVAKGLTMTSAELLRALETEAEVDPIEQAIRQCSPAMREAVRGVPRPYLATIIKATFARAIEGARDMAQLLTEPPSPITSAGESRITDRVTASNEGETEPSDRLPVLQQPWATLRNHQFIGAPA